MTTYTEVFDSLAAVLTYPSVDYKSRVEDCRSKIAELNVGPVEILGGIDVFVQGIEGLDKGGMEELYTRTFDINPVSSLEVGWHLHGETYERGTFLVQMRDLLRRCRVEESSELPDHITSVLHAIGRMDPAEASQFISSRVLKGLSKMLEGFKEESNPYEQVLVATRLLLTTFATSHEGVES